MTRNDLKGFLKSENTNESWALQHFQKTSRNIKRNIASGMKILADISAHLFQYFGLSCMNLTIIRETVGIRIIKIKSGQKVW